MDKKDSTLRSRIRKSQVPWPVPDGSFTIEQLRAKDGEWYRLGFEAIAPGDEPAEGKLLLWALAPRSASPRLLPEEAGKAEPLEVVPRTWAVEVTPIKSPEAG